MKSTGPSTLLSIDLEVHCCDTEEMRNNLALIISWLMNWPFRFKTLPYK